MKGSRDAISLRGIPLDATSFGSPTNGYAPKYVSANTRLELAALDSFTNVTLAAAGVLSWTGRSRLTSSADGALLLEKNDGTDVFSVLATGQINAGYAGPSDGSSIFQHSGLNNGAVRYVVSMFDGSASAAAGTGAGIHFGSKTDGANLAGAGGVYSSKENSTSGNHAAAVGVATNNGLGSILEAVRWTSGQHTQIPSGSVYGVSSSSTNAAAADLGLSRLSAGRGALGNGSAGDFSGALKLTELDLAGVQNRKASSKGSIANNTATTFAKVSLANNERVAGEVRFTAIQLGGTTSPEVYRGRFTFEAYRTGGTFFGDVSAVSSHEAGGGTATLTASVTDGSGDFNVRLNLNTGVGGSPVWAIYYELEVAPVATITPQ